MSASILGFGGLGGLLSGESFAPSDLTGFYDMWLAGPTACFSESALRQDAAPGTSYAGYPNGSTPASLLFNADQAFTYGFIWNSGISAGGAPEGIFNNGNANGGAALDICQGERAGTGTALNLYVSNGVVNFNAGIISGIVDNKDYLIVLTRPAGGESASYAWALDGSFTGSGASSGLAGEATNTIATQLFRIGQTGARGGSPLGTIQNFFFSKREFSVGEVTLLFNSGAGHSYESMTADGLLGNMISFWNLGERDTTGGALDLHGSNILGYTTASTTRGPVSRLATDRMPVSSFLSTLGHAAVQTQYGRQPTYYATGLNGHPTLRSDGNQYLEYNPGGVGEDQAQPNTIYSVADWNNIDPSLQYAGQTSGVRNDLYQSASKVQQYAGAFADSLIAPPFYPSRYAAIFNGAASSAYVNNVQGAVGDAGANPLRPMVLMAGGAGVQGMSGDLSFVGIQNALATAEEIASMDAWMVARFKLAFSPADLVGVTYWWEAAVGVDANPVGAWTDRISSVALTEATNKPTLVLSGQNGKPVIRFNGATTTLSGTTASIAQPFTIFIAGKAGGVNQFFIDGATGRAIVYRGSTDVWRIFSVAEAGAVAADSNFHIFTAVFNGTSSVLRVDGAEESALNPGATPFEDIVVGANTTSSGNHLAGDIGEIIVVNGLSTDSEIAATEALLAAKYGVPLA